MEVFMRDVGYYVTHHQLTIELAKILHGPRFQELSPLPFNFHVYLFKGNRGMGSHKGCGALTLPSTEIGNRFLSDYGEGMYRTSDCVVGNRRIKFSPSKRSPRPEIVETIIRQPYIDPRVAEEKEKFDRSLASKRVLLETLQFGWECRDSVLSVEWEHHFEDTGFISFDDDRRELRIKMPRARDTLAIAIRFSQISTMSACGSISGQPIIFLSLTTPPAFEIETTSIPPATSILPATSIPSAPSRTRLVALPIGDHARVAPYISLAIRLVCHSQREMMKFRDLCKSLHLHLLADMDYIVERRGLFSATVMEGVQPWLRRLNWSISFQLESLLRNLAVDMKELLDLMPYVVKLVERKGKQYAASMLRHFGPRAKDLFWDDTEDTSLVNLFQQAEQEYEALSKVSLEPTEGSLFMAYHVEVTPTTMHLTGPHPERSNRVIRRYHPDHHESFLRVSFVDEGRLQYRFDRDLDGRAFVRSRLGPLLLNNLDIAARRFQFLAYSQSALREHAVW